MNITHIIGIFSAEHGGPVVSVRNYATGQAWQGHKVSIFTVDGYRGFGPPMSGPPGIELVIGRILWPERLGRSPELRKLLLKAPAADVYHLHGIWLRAMYYGYEKATREKKPFLIEINGALDPLELATKPWRKKIARRWFQDKMLNKANCLHVNSEREARHVRALGLTNPVAVIPAGFNFAEAELLLRDAATNLPLWGKKFESSRVLLYLARIHEAKGIDLLLNAWQRIAADFADWKLVIVGPGTVDEMGRWRKECSRLGLDQRCEWIGLVSDRERAWIYQRADIYVLPSRKENFGNTVQEALGYGLPVITTVETPWLEIEKWGCGWLCRAEIGDLADALRKAIRTPNKDRKSMGQRGREIIKRDYSLESVVARQLALYAWLAGGATPAFVSFN